MRSSLVVLVLTCAACRGLLGIDEPVPATDAGTDAPGVTGDAPTADARVCFNGRVVYLNFEGVTLNKSGISDATQNRASWMNMGTGTAPPYKSGVTDRLQLIKDVTDGVRAQLSIFPVTVVTQRPAAGPYVMVVLGGTAAQVGSQFGSANSGLDCGDVEKSDVAWISDGATPTQRVVNYTVGAIGFGLGLSGTANPLDCMCGWDNNCVSNSTVPCTLSPSIARDPSANQRCAGLTMQDEAATFDTAFCR